VLGCPIYDPIYDKPFTIPFQFNIMILYTIGARLSNIWSNSWYTFDLFSLILYDIIYHKVCVSSIQIQIQHRQKRQESKTREGPGVTLNRGDIGKRDVLRAFSLCASPGSLARQELRKTCCLHPCWWWSGLSSSLVSTWIFCTGLQLCHPLMVLEKKLNKGIIWESSESRKGQSLSLET